MGKISYHDYHLDRQLYPVEYTKPGKDDNDIVEYAVKQKVRKVGDGDEDFVIEDVVEEVSRVNRQAFIAKDAPDVGVMNILEKVRRSGDVSLFNQTGAVIPEGVQDYSELPSNVGEALASLKSGSDSFAGLKAIFPNATFEELSNMSAEEISSAVAAYVAAQQKHVEEKGEQK